MCGIAGLARGEVLRPVDAEVVRRMTDVMAHRGPDAQGVHVWREAALGHRRLSIIDLATGDQPIFNEDRTKAVILNGEIYNFRAVRTELEALGAPLRDPVGHRGHRARLRGVRRAMRRASSRDVRVRVVGRDGAPASPGPRPCREEAALLRGRRGPALVRLGAEGASPGRRAEAPAEPHGAHGLSLVRGSSAPTTIFEGVAQLPPGTLPDLAAGGTRIGEYWDVPRRGVVYRDEAAGPGGVRRGLQRGGPGPAGQRRPAGGLPERGYRLERGRGEDGAPVGSSRGDDERGVCRSGLQ